LLPLLHSRTMRFLCTTGRQLEFSVTDKAGGSFVCEHKSLPEGDYFLSVCLDEQDIKHSPFLLSVRSKDKVLLLTLASDLV